MGNWIGHVFHTRVLLAVTSEAIMSIYHNSYASEVNLGVLHVWMFPYFPIAQWNFVGQVFINNSAAA